MEIVGAASIEKGLNAALKGRYGALSRVKPAHVDELVHITNRLL